MVERKTSRRSRSHSVIWLSGALQRRRIDDGAQIQFTERVPKAIQPLPKVSGCDYFPLRILDRK